MYKKFIKRFLDIIFSAMLMPIVGISILVIGPMIYFEDKGTIFYKAQRRGYKGEVFEMLKFRSMYIGAEKKGTGVYSGTGDRRVTRVGRFMRATSIDELPQLFNILIGDMSLVGPRPERPQFVEKFKEEIPRYMIKHQVRPGLTGWAQVNGYRGDTSIQKRIEFDLYYIENWTMGFDFKIIFLTFLKGFINRNAY